jgi:hypothetical protein
VRELLDPVSDHLALLADVGDAHLARVANRLGPLWIEVQRHYRNATLPRPTGCSWSMWKV